MTDKKGKRKRIKTFIRDLFELILFLLIGVIMFIGITILLNDIL